MAKTYDLKEIANYFIKKSDYTISPMKLQKLIYYAHGWYLAVFNKPLISNDIEAWKYGPVIRELYHEVSHFGNKNITEMIESLNLDEWAFYAPELSDSDDVKQFLDEVYKAYGEFSAVRLSNMTHASDGPWQKAINASSNVIGNDSIKDYFVQLSQANAEQ